MGDRLRADKLSWYVTSEPGQLSLIIHPRIGTRSTSLGLEGNRTSGIALVYPPTATGLNGLHQGDDMLLLKYGPPLPLPLHGGQKALSQPRQCSMCVHVLPKVVYCIWLSWETHNCWRCDLTLRPHTPQSVEHCSLCCKQPTREKKRNGNSVTLWAICSPPQSLSSQPTGDFVINKAVGCHCFLPGSQLYACHLVHHCMTLTWQAVNPRVWRPK